MRRGPRLWLAVASALAALGATLAATASLGVCGAAGDGILDPASSDLGRRVTATTYTRYLPFIAGARPPWEVVTVPIETKALRSTGPTHAEAFDPSGAHLRGPAGDGYVQVSIKTDDYGFYDLVRTAMRASIPEAVDVLTADVVLHDVRIGWDTFYEPLPAPTITLHPGTWARETWSDPAGLWAAYGARALGRGDTEPLYDAGAKVEAFAIGLDSTWLRPGETARLVMRDSQDHVDLREEHAGNRTRWVVGLAGATLRMKVGQGAQGEE
jgi:hypothetical protein